MEAERKNTEPKTALTAGKDISHITDIFNVKKEITYRDKFLIIT
jgi:hypothetical protein